MQQLSAHPGAKGQCGGTARAPARHAPSVAPPMCPGSKPASAGGRRASVAVRSAPAAVPGGKLHRDPVAKECSAFAPATVANLGPGFDWMGCAVQVGRSGPRLTCPPDGGTRVRRVLPRGRRQSVNPSARHARASQVAFECRGRVPTASRLGGWTVGAGGHRRWCGRCSQSPDPILMCVLQPGLRVLTTRMHARP